MPDSSELETVDIAVPLCDNYIRRAEILSVIDGDTVKLDIDNGFDQHVHTKARLFGVDTPEKFGIKKWEDKKAGLLTPEYQLGLLASNFTLEWMQTKGLLKPTEDLFGVEFTRVFVVMKSHKGKSGKYGRWLAEIYPGDGSHRSVNAALLESGNATVPDY